MRAIPLLGGIVKPSIGRVAALITLATPLFFGANQTLAQLAPGGLLRIDDLAEGPPVVTFNGSVLTPPDVVPAGDAESVFINLFGVMVPGNFTPMSFILDEPGHTATSDEVAVGGLSGTTFYQVFWQSDVGENGLGFPPNPNNPVETGDWQTLYNDGTLEIQVRSDAGVPDGGSTAALLLGALVILPFAGRMRRVICKT